MSALAGTQKPVSEKMMALMAYLLLMVAYVASGKLGLMLALPPGYATPLFPPAGIAIAAAFVGGRKTLPWIFLGSLVLNVWVGYSGNHRISLLDAEAALVIAVASMLQAALAGWGLRRLIGHAEALSNIRSTILFLLFTPLACITSATFSVGGLWALGIIGVDLATQWFSWWFGDVLGVVVMFPVMLAVLGEPRTPSFNRARAIALPVLLVLFTGFLVVYFLQQAAINTARHAQQDEFDFQGREAVLRIQQRLDSYAQVLRGARGLFVASQHVERKEFRDFVTSLDLEKRYPGIQGIGFSLIIRPDELARHIASVRSEGFPSYTPHPSGERELNTTIIYLEPFSGRNLRAFGYDMFSEPVRRAAMEQARDEDRSVMSGKVKLVQETERDIQAGFLMYLPVYRSGKPHATLAERRANIAGWVYAPFRMNDLMDGILGEQVHNVDLEIFDDARVSAETLMYDSRAGQPHNGNPLFHYAKLIEAKGRAWMIGLHSSPAFEADIDTGRITDIRASGFLISVLLALVVWQLASGRARALKLAQDITGELRQSEEQLREAQRVAHLGSWEENLVSHHLVWSDEMYHIFERDPASFQPSYPAVLDAIHPDDRALVDNAFRESVARRSPWSVEHRLLMEDGRVKYVRANGETSYDAQAQALRAIGAVQDITEQKLAQERIERMAHYDMLTKLPNRALFYDRLRQAIHVARRNKIGLTLLYMDLDGFKAVNDTLGHHTGDLLLIGVAERLSACVRESDTVARLGGDEFTVILSSMHRLEDVEAEARKIIRSMSAPFVLEGCQASVGVSIGIARYTEEADNEDDLVRRADEAMYAAKSAGKNTYRIAAADPGEFA